jgi:hypothetical protein
MSVQLKEGKPSTLFKRTIEKVREMDAFITELAAMDLCEDCEPSRRRWADNDHTILQSFIRRARVLEGK